MRSVPLSVLHFENPSFSWWKNPNIYLHYFSIWWKISTDTMFLLDQWVADRWTLHHLQSALDSHLQPPARDSTVLRSDRAGRGSDQQHHHSNLQPPAVSTQYENIRRRCRWYSIFTSIFSLQHANANDIHLFILVLEEITSSSWNSTIIMKRNGKNPQTRSVLVNTPTCSPLLKSPVRIKTWNNDEYKTGMHANNVFLPRRIEEMV